MDELRLRLPTNFLKGIIAKTIAKAMRNKFGYDITINLNRLDMSVSDGKVIFHADVDGECSTDDFTKIITQSGII